MMKKRRRMDDPGHSFVTKKKMKCDDDGDDDDNTCSDIHSSLSRDLESSKKKRRRMDDPCHSFVIKKKRKCDDEDYDDSNTCSDIHSSLSSFSSYLQSKDAIPPKETTSIGNTIGEDGPPYVVVIHGPPKVGKSILMKSLVNHFTKQNLSDFPWPIRIVSGNHRRIQFVECSNSINGMIDAAKYADAVIFIFDAIYGFKKETLEFLNLLNVHGMPKVMGVLTRLDCFTNVEKLTEAKKRIMDRFLSETYEGAAVFCLSSLNHGSYPEHEIHELASFISAMEFHPLSWRAAHPYVLVDHIEDATPPEKVYMDKKCNRDVILYGYLRGCDFKKGTKVHIAGVGDFPLACVTSLVDPFPLQYVDRNSLKVNTDELSILDITHFVPGTYLRCEVHDIPFDVVEDHDPCHPILVGGISLGEENDGYMQAKLKLHSGHQNLLKTRDPIIVSIGWRRYQTSPIYAMEDCTGRLQMLNYTPKDRQCHAVFWGPLAPPNTGVVAVQSLADNSEASRILATAVILDFNHPAKIVERSKRIGTPCKTFKKTAFIKDMFTSNLEIAMYEGATIWTTSGIQGKVNKAAEKKAIHRLRRKHGQVRGGIAKCTFEHRIRTSDIISMPVWTQVEVPRFFYPLTTATDHVWPCTETRDGTTVTVFHNESGVTIFSDGYSFDKQLNLTGTNVPKTFILGKRLLVAVCGGGNWIYVVNHLELVAGDPDWTSSRCARFARFIMTDYVPPPELYGKKEPAAMRKNSSIMVFVSLDDNETKVFIASRHKVYEVINSSRYKGSKRWDLDHETVGYKCIGSGSEFVDRYMLEMKFKSTTRERSMLASMRLMEKAVLEDKGTGGTILAHHMSPDGTISMVPPFHADEIQEYYR